MCRPFKKIPQCILCTNNLFFRVLLRKLKRQKLKTIVRIILKIYKFYKFRVNTNIISPKEIGEIEMELQNKKLDWKMERFIIHSSSMQSV